MTLVMTAMVRDEADIIAAMLEFHLAQGVDRIIVTDNASTDGTTEILQRYAERAPITLLHDDRHEKQQSEVVTAMARMAATEFDADWVLNADADEFFLPRDRGRTLAEVFRELPRPIGAFTVPVTNLVGPLARKGAGIRRLLHRDERDVETLRATGVPSHPTPNAVHVGDPEVEVAQGNHFVSIEPGAAVPEGLEIEVLHLPWRSIQQLERKTRNAGEAYDRHPDRHPSPNHHGMQDWRRMQAGVLLPFLARRSPTLSELESAAFPAEHAVLELLEVRQASAVDPEALARALDDTDDGQLDDEEVLQLRAEAELPMALEAPLYRELNRVSSESLERQRVILVLEEQLRDARAQRESAEHARDEAEARLAESQAQAAAVRDELDRIRADRWFQRMQRVRGRIARLKH